MKLGMWQRGIVIIFSGIVAVFNAGTQSTATVVNAHNGAA